MFIGVSKNLGKGFRVGLGTRIGGSNKGPSAKELKTQEFQEFLEKVNEELKTFVITFIQANNKDYKEILENDSDLDEVFSGNSDYQEFLSIFNKSKLDIEKVLFSGDNGVVAKRQITDAVFEIRSFLNQKYPGFVPNIPAASIKSGTSPLFRFFIYVGVAIIPFVFVWFTLKKGFSKTGRIISFIWFTLVLVATITVPEPDKEGAKNTSSQIQSK